MSTPTAATFFRLHRALLWALAVWGMLLSGLLVQQLSAGWHIETDLQALLPDSADNAVVAAAEKQFAAAAARNVLLLLSAGSKDEVRRAADQAAAFLQPYPQLTLRNPADGGETYKAQVDLYLPHQFQLLSARHRELLVQGRTQQILREAERSLYDLSAVSRVSPPAEDPLNLFNQYFAALPTGPDNVHLEQGHLFVAAPGSPPADRDRHTILLALTMNASPFDLETQAAVTGAIEALESELRQQFAGLDMLRSGVVFHAARATAKAKRDITFITGGSIAGIVLLFWLAFRSARPLLISVASLGFGCLSALLVCHWLFGGVHLITLVFGASLTGVSVDYSLHYFSQSYAGEQTVQPPMRRIFTALTLGLVTSVIGYGCLLQSPLPGLRQMAVFSVVGLASVWLFVAALYPFVALTPATRSRWLLRLAAAPEQGWLALGTAKTRGLLALLLLAAVAVNTAWLHSSHNPRSFYAPAQDLLEQERRLHEQLQSFAPSQFFTVTAADEQTLLQREADFLLRLERLKAEGAIQNYSATSRYLPSVREQKENYRLLEQCVYGSDGAAYEFMRKLGFEEAALEALRERFARERGHFLNVGQWLEKAGEEQRLLWLGDLGEAGEEGARYASLIALRGIEDVRALERAAAGAEGIAFVDKVQNLAAVLRLQHASASRVLMIAYAVVAGLLIAYYRRAAAASLIFAPLLSTLLTLALLSAAAIPISLFHVFALFLVLGLGMDYSIFLRESAAREDACLLAITLSALTSCLSFGLLCLSSTPMVQAFGITILTGSLLNLILAPAVRVSAGYRE